MVPGWTYHATPAAPDTVGTIMLKELDDIELVVVGTDVGLVQGAVVILVDLQQAAQPRLTPGQRLGMGGCRAVPAGMQRGLQGKLGLPLCQQGRDCHGTPPSLLPTFPHPHLTGYPSLTLTWAPGAMLRGHSPSMVAGGFSLGAVFRAAKVDLQASSSSPPFAFLPLPSGCFGGDAWRLEAMTEPPPRGQHSLNPPAKSLGRAEQEVRDAKLPFRESLAGLCLTFSTPPAHGQDGGGDGTSALKCLSLAPLLGVGGRAPQHHPAPGGPQSGDTGHSPVTWS